MDNPNQTTTPDSQVEIEPFGVFVENERRKEREAKELAKLSLPPEPPAVTSGRSYLREDKLDLKRLPANLRYFKRLIHFYRFGFTNAVTDLLSEIDTVMIASNDACYSSTKTMATVIMVSPRYLRNLLTDLYEDGIVLTLGWHDLPGGGATTRRIVAPKYSSDSGLSQKATG